MKLQNPALKGSTLSLRYTRDEDGRPIQVTADANGVFDLSKVNEKDVALLRESPGWRTPQKAPSAPAKPAPAPAPTVAATVKDGPVESPPPAPKSESEEGDGDEDSDEGPDIDGLRTKAQAVQLAEAWRAKGYDIPELDADTMKLSEMKDALEQAIYGEE